LRALDDASGNWALPEEPSKKHRRIVMRKATLAGVWIMALAAVAYGSEPNSSFTRMLQIPGARELVVVAEGDFEPRGVGSYTLRVYGGATAQFPLDDFVAGAIRPRNGTVERVLFENLNGDDTLEIIVVLRSVGSGGYLSADAFRYRARSLDWMVSVADLDKRVDPVAALKHKLDRMKERSASP
jgi:hypothetical protein